jgi:DNA polymerase-3 subunit alpha
MASLKDKFVQGCIANKVESNVAEQLWKDMEQAQDYSFNKSHAACYALIAYRTAYLRANYPAEYMAALISSVMNTKDRVPFYVAACEEMGLAVLPPDVNVSAAEFAVRDGKIRFGLNAVKNVGETAVAAIIAARGPGSPPAAPFASIWDFCERVDPQVVNKRALESLVKCGALDSTGATRKGMLAVLEQSLALGARQHSDRLAGQGSIFDIGLDSVETERSHQHPPIVGDEFEKAELLAFEKESLGLWVSEHPLHGVKDALRRKADLPLAELAGRRDGDVVTVGGIVGALRSLTTRKGDPMAFVRLDDLSGSTEVIVFNSAYAAARDLLEEDRVLLVKGRVDHKEGETKLVALEVTAFEVAAERSEVRLRVDARLATRHVIRELAEVVRGFPGDSAVVVSLETSAGPRTLAFGPDFKVRPEPDFFAEVKALLGEAAVT